MAENQDKHEPNMQFTDPNPKPQDASVTPPAETTEERVRRIQEIQNQYRVQQNQQGQQDANVQQQMAVQADPNAAATVPGPAGGTVPTPAATPAPTNTEPAPKNPVEGASTGKVEYAGENQSKEGRLASPSATGDDVQVEATAGKTERQAALEEAQKILKKHGGLEANIPITDAYWALMNKYRTQ